MPAASTQMAVHTVYIKNEILGSISWSLLKLVKTSLCSHLKLDVSLGSHICNFVCRRWLTSYKIQKVLTKHIIRREQQEKTTIRTSIMSHLCLRKHFHKNPVHFRINAGFEADNAIDNSSIGNQLSSGVTNTNKTTNTFAQNPFCNEFYFISGLKNVLKSG